MKIEVNDLYDYGLKIYQADNLFKFSLDSILLAEFVDVRKNTQLIVDFCTGTAAVPLILSTKYLAKIKGIEIQKNVSKLAYNSVVLNNLENQIEIINDNLSSALEYILPESVDAITCNPPYFKMNEGSYLNIDEEKRIARHEIATNLEQIIVTAKYLLRNRAPIYMVHRPERLMEIINLLTKYNFKIKKLQFVYSSYEKSAIMVLIKATKNGAEGLIVNKPLNISGRTTYKNIFS